MALIKNLRFPLLVLMLVITAQASSVLRRSFEALQTEQTLASKTKISNVCILSIGSSSQPELTASRKNVDKDFKGSKVHINKIFLDIEASQKGESYDDDTAVEAAAKYLQAQGPQLISAVLDGASDCKNKDLVLLGHGSHNGITIPTHVRILKKGFKGKKNAGTKSNGGATQSDIIAEALVTKKMAWSDFKSIYNSKKVWVFACACLQNSDNLTGDVKLCVDGLIEPAIFKGAAAWAVGGRSPGCLANFEDVPLSITDENEAAFRTHCGTTQLKTFDQSSETLANL